MTTSNFLPAFQSLPLDGPHCGPLDFGLGHVTYFGQWVEVFPSVSGVGFKRPCIV